MVVVLFLLSPLPFCHCPITIAGMLVLLMSLGCVYIMPHIKCRRKEREREQEQEKALYVYALVLLSLYSQAVIIPNNCAILRHLN